MEPRVIDVIKRILADPSAIEEIHKSDAEFYFRFRGIPMSILYGPSRRETGPYSLYIYPTSKTRRLDSIAQLSVNERWEEPDMLSYHVTDYADADEQLFSDLYALMRKRFTNVDGLFDTLLS
jgi:hypothetical protein